MKNTKILISILSIISTNALAASRCDMMLPFGYPSVTVIDTSQLCRIAYTVLHDNKRKVPVYSAEWMLPENLQPKVKRVNAFRADPDLATSDRSELTDYDKEYDRGHMTPFEDASSNSAAARQTFYLSNMVPQNLHVNRGMWKQIENQTRTWAKTTTNGLYIMTGPVFVGEAKTIGNGVSVPSSIYKIIINKTTMQGVGFIVPNSEPAAGVTFNTYKVSISEVEKVTGINFTPTNTNKFKQTIGDQFK